MITLPLIATMVIGAWAGYLTAALSLVIYVVFAALAQSGLLGNWLTVQTNPLDLGFWVEAGTALIVFLALMVMLLARFHRLRVRTLAAKQHASAELRRQNEYLAALNETALGVMSRLDLAELL